MPETRAAAMMSDVSSSAIPAPARRTLTRRPDHGFAGGVAAGIAEHLGIPTRTVRIAFLVLALAGGLGLALYGAYWIVLPPAPGVRPRISQPVEVVLAVIVGAVALGGLATSLPSSGLIVPTVLGCLGGALLWRQASDTERERWREFSRSSLSGGMTASPGRLRLAVGVGLVVAGAALVIARSTSVAVLRDALPAVLVLVIGLVLVTGPWWMRLAAQLMAERAERIRSQERADLAAQLHDSVLQTLALIQRNAASPKEVARLARGQERELRALLYGGDAAQRPQTVADALRQAAAEVEDAYVVPIEAVIVGGEAPIGGPDVAAASSALVAAAREAMVNAARHSGADRVSLYAEVEDDDITVFVRDRGAGFDQRGIAPDRQGVRRSIVERMERHGGTAAINSVPGAGTEVVLTLPRRQA